MIKKKPEDNTTFNVPTADNHSYKPEELNATAPQQQVDPDTMNYMTKKKLRPFVEARVRMDGAERTACVKCGKKCRYLADIGGDMVCKSCYEDFRKHFDESEDIL